MPELYILAVKFNCAMEVICTINALSETKIVHCSNLGPETSSFNSAIEVILLI